MIFVITFRLIIIILYLCKNYMRYATHISTDREQQGLDYSC